MASIQEYLDLIKNAIYGKDVRQAIHDGIQQCYYDGKAGSTDLEARQRLDSAEESITFLGSRMSTAEGDIDTLDARVDQIVAPSGEAPSSAEVSDARIGDDGVTYNSLGSAIRTQFSNVKTDLTKIRNNMPIAGAKQLLNPYTAIILKARVTTQGKLVSDANYYAIVVPISVKAGSEYRAKYLGNSSTFGTMRLYSFNSYAFDSYAVDSPTIYGASGSILPTTTTASYLIVYFSLSTGTIGDVVDNLMVTEASDYPSTYVPYYIPVESAIQGDMDKIGVPQIKANMPTAGKKQLLNPETITTISARVTNLGELVVDSGYKAIIIPVSVEANSEYRAKFLGSGATFGTIRLYSFDSVAIGSYAVDSPTIYGANGSILPTTTDAAYLVIYCSISTGTLEDVINGMVVTQAFEYPTEYTPYYISVDTAIHNAVGVKTSPDCIEVGTSSYDYEYTNINTAVLANPSSIIKINYGTYETEVTDRATDKILIGEDVDLCVLTGTDKDYDTPPIEIAGGMIKHLTVVMVNDESASHKGYCVHSDDSACEDNTLIVEDCHFRCEGQHAIGMGIFKGETVIFKNCEFIFKDVQETPTNAPFFAHNAGGVGGDAIVKFHNCIFRGSGYAMKLSAWNADSTLHFEFINCTCESDTMTGDEMIWTDYIVGGVHDQTRLHEFSGKMLLLETSHGNNIDLLNYSA